MHAGAGASSSGAMLSPAVLPYAGTLGAGGAYGGAAPIPGPDEVLRTSARPATPVGGSRHSGGGARSTRRSAGGERSAGAQAVAAEAAGAAPAQVDPGGPAGGGRGRRRTHAEIEQDEDDLNGLEPGEYTAGVADGVGTQPTPSRYGRFGPPADRLPRNGRALGFPLMAYSLTLAIQSRSVPMSWLNDLADWCSANSVVSMFASYERVNHGHIQAMIKLYWPPNPGYADRLKELIQERLHTQRADGSTFMVKPFARTQSWSAMLAYCQKDMGMQHYAFVRQNVTNEELVTGRREYRLVGNDHFTGSRKLLLSKDFVALVQAFWKKYLSPYRMPLEQVVYYMIVSCMYEPEMAWLTPPLGSGVNHQCAAAFWKAMQHPEEVTMLDIVHLFFEVPGGRGSTFAAKCYLCELGYTVNETHLAMEERASGVTSAHLTGGGGGRRRSGYERMLIEGEPVGNCVEILYNDVALPSWTALISSATRRRNATAEVPVDSVGDGEVFVAEGPSYPNAHEEDHSRYDVPNSAWLWAERNEETGQIEEYMLSSDKE
ncbi:hypothetical protein HYH03_019056 [Edaphochlamys debaryana]|uniref:Uncharacterized protein n=1 Tax=Edaphochlamys debaryana TaxID=47281 RepID=A0A836BMJ3_9CHLO|nr:hypothetical protein HYH03_019056 [Edaphochlamys debaryana]|eukprot:KAG2481990.1 hypothetical protein HYH03_019056 [Edaphochlamys debaryana]